MAHINPPTHQHINLHINTIINTVISTSTPTHKRNHQHIKTYHPTGSWMDTRAGGVHKHCYHTHDIEFSDLSLVPGQMIQQLTKPAKAPAVAN
jgi:hypothetical protein